MILTQLIYASRKGDAWQPSDIEDILEVARRENSKKNLTGLLCFHRKSFLQVIEGQRALVSELFAQILKDERHKDLLLLKFSEISQRQFDNWSMGFIPESSLTSEVLLRHSCSNEFDPFHMTGENALNLLCDLKKVVPTL